MSLGLFWFSGRRARAAGLVSIEAKRIESNRIDAVVGLTTTHLTHIRAEGDGFETSSSGLKSKILKEGTGAVPAPGQTINGALWLGAAACGGCIDARNDPPPDRLTI